MKIKEDSKTVIERHSDLSSEISRLLMRIAALDFLIDDLSRNLEVTEIVLTPDDGWEGKTVADRDQTREETLLLNPGYQEVLKRLKEVEEEKRTFSARIKAREAERRSLEWTMRLIISANDTSAPLLEYQPQPFSFSATYKPPETGTDKSFDFEPGDFEHTDAGH